MSLKVGIVGAAGYAGAELIRLVLGHPEFELVAITSNADAGQPLSAVYPSFAGVSDLVFTTHDAPELKSCDAVFLAVPHTAAMAQVPALLASGVSCFDLSADYRLSDASVFEAWYAAEHTSPELLKTRAFGLPELFSQDLETAASDHADGKPVLNQDLWELMVKELARHKVRFHWVEGHAGHQENEEVDTLARLAATRPGLPRDTGFSPA